MKIKNSKLNDINDAFDILFSEFDIFLDENNEKGAELFKERRYSEVKEFTCLAEDIEGIIKNLSSLQDKWESIVQNLLEPESDSEEISAPEETSIPEFHNIEDNIHNIIDVKSERREVKFEKRARKGTRLSRYEYLIPILIALNKVGGESRVKEVLDEVYLLVRHKLTDIDYEKFKKGEIKWQNAVKWERFDMVTKGLLAGNSPKGIWEITDLGRKYLQEHIQSYK